MGRAYAGFNMTCEDHSFVERARLAGDGHCIVCLKRRVDRLIELLANTEAVAEMRRREIEWFQKVSNTRFIVLGE